MSQYRTQILLCAGGACISSGCESIRDALERELKAAGLEEEVQIIITGCMGMCEIGPMMIVSPEGIFYQKLKPEDMKEVVAEHLIKGNIVERLLYKRVDNDELVRFMNDIPFFKLQKKIALRNCGRINPEEIDEYIAVGGYEALGKVLTSMTPEDVIQEVLTSGLRGRGGAGFPTGMKWSFCAKEKADQKYILCNADEGDPGAFMDRSLLEGDPHSIVEAMAIAGYAIGATQGYVYVRAEYPLAIQRLTIALNQAREKGLLGKNIFNSGFDFDLQIRMGAGAFVCGEETALMRSIEGNRGEPRPRPPFPAQKGLFEKPTVLNNVETYANVPYIIMNGGAEFAKIGSGKSTGTKVFALAGHVNNSGLVEVPMGITLREIVYDIGGGIRGGKDFKAVQIGGPSGGCIPKEYLDTPITYESLPQLGAIMGSGGLIVMNEDACMVDVARYFMDFIQDESCGKCTPCRIGTKIMLDLLNKITHGTGTMADLEQLEYLAEQIRQSALCALGQTAPNPILSTLRYFRQEYLEHINEKKCRSKVCRALVHYSIDPAICKGCGLCKKACPADAISGEVRSPHHINPEVCVRCGACMQKCKFNAISVN